MSAMPMPEPLATPRSTGRIVLAGRDAHNGAGQPDLDRRRRRRRRRALNRRRERDIGHDRNEVGRWRPWPFCGYGRHSPTCCPSPAEYLLRTNLPEPSHLCHAGTGSQRLLDDPCLILGRPATATDRSRQNLDPPEFTLRVIINVKHNDSSKPLCLGQLNHRPDGH
jgi:hypothetical protein